jgi:phosphatidylglycerol:prolipoprotein diacylglycerol transferase
MIPILDFGFAQIPTYFFVISLSLSLLLFFLSYRVDKFLIERKVAFDIAIILMVGGFIGGRLFHVFYEEWDYYRNDPRLIFYFWNGGFVYFGGLISGWLSVWFYCWKKRISFLSWADFFAPILSLSHALGRIGCILSGCCFGTYCTLPWSIQGRHPTASYLAVGEFLIFLIIMGLERYAIKHEKAIRPGHLFFKWIFLSSLLRYIIEFYRDDFRGHFFHLYVFGTISVSQLICLGLMFISLGFFIYSWIMARRLTKSEQVLFRH